MKPTTLASRVRYKMRHQVACRACGLGRCCRDGVEVDLFEAARILKRLQRQPLGPVKPWFRYLRADKRFPSGFVFSTVVRDKRCVFQGKDMRCRIYPVRPRYCREFPLEDGRVAPYYHQLCHHAPARRRKRRP
ncbi:MAG: YkgJ family cysteine cluster protein [Candidatus Omnitrophota bacterium]